MLADLWDLLRDIWPHLLATLHLVVATAASAHVVLRKRDSRAAISWAGLIWLSPFIGAILYTVFGINRIRRKAHSLRGQPYATLRSAVGSAPARAPDQLGPDVTQLESLADLMGRVTQLPLLPGNSIQPLVRGDDAYAQMLDAIDHAQRSVALASYIFDNDVAGQKFVAALQKAKERGVKVCVIVDDIGARYTRPTIVGPLREAGIAVARFLPSVIPGWSAYSNLRSHRKILVADGRLGFTGGMNIRGGYIATPPAEVIQDMHFRVEGPVVAHLQQTFADDWEFCTHEQLTGEAWFPPLSPAGNLAARGIADGPDENLDKLHMAILGALACARSTVHVVTPYFLPDSALISALNIAALRGVEVNIVLPQVNNLRMVQWACMGQLWQVLQRGCKVWLSPPPFDHSKLMVVDRAWSLVGSGNWDPRSLRLNFEFNVECYGRELAEQIAALIESKMHRAKTITLADVDGRSLPVRLRDGIARLFSPYL